MGRGVAVEPLQPQGDFQQVLDVVVLVTGLFQARLDLHRLGQGGGGGRIVGHHLGQAIDLAQGQLHHPADIAQHRAGLQGAEGDDLGDPVVAVFLLDIGDHLLPPLLAEVDVEVGHGHPFGVQKPLEQQAKAQRVQVGDGQDPGHQRAGAGPAPGSHRDAVRLGPLDEVRHDQEIAGEAHLGDDPDLPLQPLVIGLQRRRGRVHGQPRGQALARLMGHFLGLGAPADRGKAGQDRVALLDREGAAAGDVEAVVAGLRQVGEQLAHLARGLETVLGRDLAPFVLADKGALGDAEQGVMRLVHVAAGEIDVVGGHQRGVGVIGPGHQPGLGQGFTGLAVTLQLHIEAVAERPAHLVQHRPGLARPPGGEQGVHRPVRPAGQQKQALGVLRHPRPGHARLVRRLDIQIGGRGQGHQVQIADLVLGQQHHGRNPRPALGRAFADPGHRQHAADDRLDPGVLGVAGKFQPAEQIGPVGQGHGRHVVGRRQLADRLGLDRAFQQGIGRAHPQVHKPQIPALGHSAS